MNYEQMWKDLEKHLMKMLEETDTKSDQGLFVTAGLGNALLHMDYLEDKYRDL